MLTPITTGMTGFKKAKLEHLSKMIRRLLDEKERVALESLYRGMVSNWYKERAFDFDLKLKTQFERMRGKYREQVPHSS